MPAFVGQLWMAPLLIGWLSLVAPPLRARVPKLSASEIGLLRRGRRAAMATAVAELHSEDLVEVRRRGDLARGPSSMRSGFAELPKAVYAMLVVPAPLRRLRSKPRVRRALTAATAGLARHGLLPGRTRWLLARTLLLVTAVAAIAPLTDGSDAAVAILGIATIAWFMPRRTVAGHRVLSQLRRQHVRLLSVPPANWKPPRAAIGYGLTGNLPSALQSALRRRRIASRHHDFGGMGLGDGVSAGYGGTVSGN